MRVRKLLSVVLAFVMVMSLLPMAAMGAEFDDTRGHWAEASINRWSDAGVLNGSDGGFNPNGSMTRAQAAQVFTNLLGLKSTEGAQTFKDVPANAWYADAIAKANAAGIMGGVGDGQMNPDGTVSREMFFTMFARALGIKPQESTSGAKADGASWSEGYINALTDKGFVKGTDSGVDALATMNRASMAALLDQTISTYANEPGATVTGTGEGVILVVADEVTVTGSVETLVVAEGAQDETGAAGVTLQDAAVGSLNVVAKAEVALEGATSVATVAVAEAAGGASVSVGADAKVETVEVAAENAALEVKGEVGTVAVAETAAAAEVTVAAGASVKSVETAAAETKIDNSGVIETVAVAETATGAAVTAAAGSYTGAVETAAASTTVSGSGAVAKVEATGDAATGADAASVTTRGTAVETTAADGTTSTATNAGAVPAASSSNSAAAATAAANVAAEDTGSSGSGSSGSGSNSSGSTGSTATTTTSSGATTIALTKVELEDETVEVGFSKTLSPIFTPGNATNTSVTWASSAEGVAIVSGTGVVTGVSAGTANITVTSTADSSKTDTCTVTVVPAATYDVTVSAGSGGTVVASKDKAAREQQITLTVTPDSGNELDTLTVKTTAGETPVTVTTGAPYTFIMPAEAVTVTATFKAAAPTGTVTGADFTVKQNDSGATASLSVTVANATFSGNTASNFTFASLPAGMSVSAVSASGTGATLTISGTPTTVAAARAIGNLTIKKEAFSPALSADLVIATDIEATVVASTATVYDVTIGSHTNGTLVADKSSGVTGDTVTLTVTPNSGYSIGAVTWNDGSSHTITPVNGVYSFQIGAAAPTVSAEFSAKTLKEIAIATAPTKVDYIAGQNFDASGMTITVTYTDNSTETLPYSSMTSLSPANGSSLSNGTIHTASQNVTVTYTFGEVTKTATQAISVAPATFTVSGTVGAGSTGLTSAQLAGIEVVLYNDETTPEVVGRGTTAAGGAYTITPDVPADTYTAKIVSDGESYKDSASTGTAVSSNTTINFDLVGEPFTIALNLDSGTMADGSSSVTTNNVGKLAAAPAAPTKAGYLFDGWYTDSGKTAALDVSTKVYSSTDTLYAKWLETSAAITTKAFTAKQGATVNETVTITLTNGTFKLGATGFTSSNALPAGLSFGAYTLSEDNTVMTLSITGTPSGTDSANVSSIVIPATAFATPTMSSTLSASGTLTITGAAADATVYSVTVADADGGTVTANPTSAASGTVTLTVTPDEGYYLAKISAAKTTGGDTVELTTSEAQKTYTFSLAADTTVTPVFYPYPSLTFPTASLSDESYYGVPKANILTPAASLNSTTKTVTFEGAASMDKATYTTGLSGFANDTNISAGNFIAVKVSFGNAGLPAGAKFKVEGVTAQSYTTIEGDDLYDSESNSMLLILRLNDVLLNKDLGKDDSSAANATTYKLYLDWDGDGTADATYKIDPTGFKYDAVIRSEITLTENITFADDVYVLKGGKLTVGNGSAATTATVTGNVSVLGASTGGTLEVKTKGTLDVKGDYTQNTDNSAKPKISGTLTIGGNALIASAFDAEGTDNDSSVAGYGYLSATLRDSEHKTDAYWLPIGIYEFPGNVFWDAPSGNTLVMVSTLAKSAAKKTFYIGVYAKNDETRDSTTTVMWADDNNHAAELNSTGFYLYTHNANQFAANQNDIPGSFDIILSHEGATIFEGSITVDGNKNVTKINGIAKPAEAISALSGP